MKDEESYLKNQSAILQESLDFWQDKAMQQIEYCDLLEAEESSSEEDKESAENELEYLMARLSWNSLELEKMDAKIQKFLKKKKNQQ